MFLEDLSPCSYFSEFCGPDEKLKAVGWLGSGHAYTRRRTRTPEPRFRQLVRLVQSPWEPCHDMGYHDCEFCPEEMRPLYRMGRIECDGYVAHFGVNNLFVPGQDCVYVAPSMILHYIDVHDYEPPELFWEAVMNCPEMHSEAYGRALVVNGPSTKYWARATNHWLAPPGHHS
jgi:hypothetical protein